MRSMYLAILAGQIILFGIVYMIENALHKRQPKETFWRRRWRTIVLGAAIFIHVNVIAFMHGSGLL